MFMYTIKTSLFLDTLFECGQNTLYIYRISSQVPRALIRKSAFERRRSFEGGVHSRGHSFQKSENKATVAAFKKLIEDFKFGQVLTDFTACFLNEGQ